jgi:hypothetical protein
MKYRTLLTKNWWTYFLVLAGIISIPLRTFQIPPCTRMVTGPLNLKFHFNCDSAQFMQDSQDLSRLLTGETSYQDRPLYSLLAHALSLPLKIFLQAKQSFVNSEGLAIDFYYANLVAFYIIHLSVLFTSLYFLLKFMDYYSNTSRLTVLSIVSLLFLNDITKTFFWTPHSQLFGLLLITFGLYSWKLFQEKQISKSKLLWFSCSSLLIFFYPIFVLLLVIPLVTAWRQYLIPVVLSALPYAIFPQLLNSFGGSYRSAAVEDFNQFIWVADPNFTSLAKQNLSLFIDSLSPLLLMLTLLLFSFLIVVIFSTQTDWRNLISGRTKVLGVFFLSYFSFLYFMGFYAQRLTIPLLGGLLTILLLAISRFDAIKITRLVPILVLVISIYQFLTPQMIS